jgi:hypothetical protein
MSNQGAITMFGLFGNKEHKKAANRIGIEIHRQLFEALEADEASANKNLSSAFIPGYLIGFIWFGFTTQGYEGEKLLNKYTKHICNGVLPGKLYEIFNKQHTALDIAKDLGKNEEIELYEKGIEVGVYDSGVFSVFAYNEANNLFNYLTNQELHYESMPE